MTLQARHVGTRLLLILALAAALLAGIVAVGWAMRYSSVAHAVVTSSQLRYMAPLGNGDGGGKLRTTSVGSDSGGGHIRTGPVGGDLGGGR